MNDNGIMNGRLPIAKSIREDLAGDIEKRNSLRESKLKIQKSLKAILQRQAQFLQVWLLGFPRQLS